MLQDLTTETIVWASPVEDHYELGKSLRLDFSSFPLDAAFRQPLQQLFFRVIVYDYLRQALDVGLARVNEELLALVRREKPKYLLWLTFGEFRHIQPSTFDAIRQEGTRVVGWFCDDEVRFDIYSKWWAPHLDHIVTNDPQAVAKYGQLGAHAVQATPVFGAMQRQAPAPAEKYDVSFCGALSFSGSSRSDRQEHIQVLEEKGITVSLFGKDVGKFLSYQEMADVFAGSKINLSFSRTFDNATFGIKGRVFEVCLAGGFLLTEYAPGMEGFFQIDREIVCFQNPEDMLAKVTYYLEHEDERQAIARAGWERAGKEHTPVQVMARVFQQIEEYGSRDVAVRPQLHAMPAQIRRRASAFYRSWGNAFLVENHKGLWRDALALAISYDPSNIRLRLLHGIGLLPSLRARSILLRLDAAEHRLRMALLTVLGSIPLVRKTYYRMRRRTA